MKNRTLQQDQKIMKRAKELHQNDVDVLQNDFMKLPPKDKMKYILKAEKEERLKNMETASLA